MKIEMVPSVDYINSVELSGKIAIIIDVLRATSVITTALNNGALEVIPVLKVEEALRLRAKDTILGGERKALKIEGFDLSNSPLEYSQEIIKGKKIVLSTTNGTKAIHGAEAADKIIIGSMLNGRAISEYVLKEGKDVVIVCAGTYGKFSLDDFICGGKIAKNIMEGSSCEHDDLTVAAIMNYESCKDNLVKGVSNAAHYKYLISIGLFEDIKYCFMEDLYKVVPIAYKKSNAITIQSN